MDDDTKAEIESLKVNQRQLQRQVHDLEEQMDTFVLTPIWKRLLFFLDGWPLTRIVTQAQWRPWRKWWHS